MITSPKPSIRFHHVASKPLPGWVWESLHTAARETPAGMPAAVVLDPQSQRNRSLVLIDVEDWQHYITDVQNAAKEEAR